MAGPFAPPNHPALTSRISNQVEANPYPYAPLLAHVWVSVAAAEKGTVATSFSAKTSHLYGSFKTTNTDMGERIHAVWINSSTKKPLYKTDMISTQSNFFGTVSINAPPAGQYELDIYLGNKLEGRANFNMRGLGN
jgi:hypothetical protein